MFGNVVNTHFPSLEYLLRRYHHIHYMAACDSAGIGSDQTGIQPDYDIETLGDMIIKAAEGIVEETELAAFLRSLPIIEV